MAAAVFQNIVNQIKNVSDVGISIADCQGYIVASSDLNLVNTRIENFKLSDFESGDGTIVTDKRIYKTLVSGESRPEYIVFAEGSDDVAKAACSIALVAFGEAKSNYEENHNKAAFIKNIISDNILPGDVYVRAKELNFVTDEQRSVLLVRQLGNPDVAAMEFIQRLFPDKQRDFVISVNENDIVIVKAHDFEDTPAQIMAIAENIESELHKSLGIKCVIGVSTTARHLRELADRYKEAQVAIEVGRVFESEKNIINYESLGLGRIIYQLPTTLCEMFLNEVFKKSPIETLDDDALETINKFFENNLNVSETSRKLYVHRNTLVYRIEKIKKITGLDLREFDDAIVFKVAMMVKMYLDSLGISRY